MNDNHRGRDRSWTISVLLIAATVLQQPWTCDAAVATNGRKFGVTAHGPTAATYVEDVDGDEGMTDDEDNEDRFRYRVRDDNDEYQPSFAVDDKPKRGAWLTSVAASVPQNGVGKTSQNSVGKTLHEKKFDRPPSSPYPSVGPGNGLHLEDTPLLRGETVDLPTYVNVPVTLRCRFTPLNGGNGNKFETVVEAMYPGHADSPPPPADSYASRVINQLMNSVDGWRDVVGKYSRPVRRVIELGRHTAWPPVDSADDGDAEDDDLARRRITPSRRRYEEIEARRQVAERLHRFWNDRQRPSDTVKCPKAKRNDWNRVGDRRPVELQRFEEDLPDENQLLIDQQVDGQAYEQQVYDQQVYDQQVDGEAYDQQVDVQAYDQQVDGQTYDQQVDQQVYGQAYDQQVDEQVYDQQVVDHVTVDQTDDQQPGDRTTSEEVDERRFPDKRPTEEPHPKMTVPYTTSTPKWDYVTFGKDMPVRTYMEHVMTTPSSLSD